MVNTASVKLYEVKGRHSINLPSVFVKDSAFPFKVGEDLIAKIEDGKVVIGKGGSGVVLKRKRGI
jgi:hypothetical protein